jgi:hypothetical protein
MRKIKVGDIVRVLGNTASGIYSADGTYKTMRRLRVNDKIKVIQGPLLLDGKEYIVYHCPGQSTYIGDLKPLKNAQITLLSEVALLAVDVKFISFNAVQSLVQSGTNSFVRSKKTCI